MADEGEKHLKRYMGEAQSDNQRITPPKPMAQGNRPDGDAPKPPKHS